MARTRAAKTVKVKGPFEYPKTKHEQHYEYGDTAVGRGPQLEVPTTAVGVNTVPKRIGTVCLMILVAEFETPPTADEVQEIISKVAETGEVTKCQIRYLRPQVVEMV